MKLNKYFMLGLAGLAFAACSNEDEGNDCLLYTSPSPRDTR